ncbi:MAG: 6-phosphogluconolactonase [Christensenellales bacterium]|jgi:glucosamine-6-phosphate deaminase|nr:glucosamine-6-phosphate isomerase [Christensenellaceae bacterium]
MRNCNQIYMELIHVVQNEWDVYFETALVMLHEIMQNNEKGKPTVMIVPVGPTEQYGILARLVNELSLSLHNVHFFNMDEYLIDKKCWVPFNHPLCFRRRMEEEFFCRVNPELVMSESQRHFPKPGEEAEFDALLDSFGGADLCVGGLGINGHLAFNEPPEDNTVYTVDEFASLCTRILPVSRETRTVNAIGYQRGDLYGMPQWCITIGMKQILSSRSIFIALNREWQHGILRQTLCNTIQAQIPATLLRTHSNVRFCTTEKIAQGIV